MKIAILGTRGIPNHYGGFEQFAEYLAVGLNDKGHDVTVYNGHAHPFQEREFKGARIKHLYDPENKIGTAGQFIYDLFCILDSRKETYDVILQLGYTSSSVFFDFHPSKSVVVTNMDGLEWKRTKYNRLVQKFLESAEALAVKKSDFLISDSIGIQNYIKNKYDIDSFYIPYGANVVDIYEEGICEKFDVEPYRYDMLVARLEPENSLEVILDGVVKASTDRTFLVIGKHETKYGRYLKRKFANVSRIRFVGGVYNQDYLNNLRNFSNIYFHGHTVGGTNPSLLEAMASNALICAHKNEFNSAILGKDAFFFEKSEDIKQIIETTQKKNHQKVLRNNIAKIQETYNWNTIIEQYEKCLLECLSRKRKSVKG